MTMSFFPVDDDSDALNRNAARNAAWTDTSSDDDDHDDGDRVADYDYGELEAERARYNDDYLSDESEYQVWADEMERVDQERNTGQRHREEWDANRDVSDYHANEDDEQGLPGMGNWHMDRNDYLTHRPIARLMQEQSAEGSTDSETEEVEDPGDMLPYRRDTTAEADTERARNYEGPLLSRLITYIMRHSHSGSPHITSSYTAKMRAESVCNMMRIKAFDNFQSETIAREYYVSHSLTLRQWMASENRNKFLTSFATGNHFISNLSELIRLEDRKIKESGHDSVRKTRGFTLNKLYDLTDAQIHMLEDLLIRGIRPDPYAYRNEL